MDSVAANDGCSHHLASRWLGSEPFLVGIAPIFWAHVPMSVATINHLELIHGIHCWPCKGYHIPVSKCVLVGCIVNATIRSSDMSSLYVLDDGTGLIDFLVWDNDNVNNLFNLPYLGPHGQENESTRFQIGEVVRVFGKIQCVTNNETKRAGMNPHAVREIHGSLVERTLNSSNEEAKHWKACVDMEEAMTSDPTKFNALGFLDLLGPDITLQVKDGLHLPSADDALGEWRVFGPSCNCVLDYKAELLYCHCLAKVEPLDPQLKFRDAILNHLLGVQRKLSSVKLVFLYRAIKTNQDLREIASCVLSSIGEPKPGSKLQPLIDRLVLNTFRALRHDGIVHLEDENSDKYLLISRKWVMEPYIKFQMASRKDNQHPQKFRGLEGIPYFSRVHRNRLRYIRRCLVHNSTCNTHDETTDCRNDEEKQG